MQPSNRYFQLQTILPMNSEGRPRREGKREKTGKEGKGGVVVPEGLGLCGATRHQRPASPRRWQAAAAAAGEETQLFTLGLEGTQPGEGGRLGGKLGPASHLWVPEALTSLDLNRDKNGAEGRVIIAGNVSVLLLGSHTRPRERSGCGLGLGDHRPSRRVPRLRTPQTPPPERPHVPPLALQRGKTALTRHTLVALLTPKLVILHATEPPRHTRAMCSW
ncbi:hypothetical protein E2C01_044446 [Portunus trituberculatus]|uniref:Uncharacterized protein n=1 Tax=Portunus trituberculatus TaxID=210409 RepID=A0A5B7FZ25_PORTR|nr:hypothetical protein [Portunus trituberculatus]